MVELMNIKGGMYLLSQKSADRYGEYRFDLLKEEDGKVYSLSISSTLYRDSTIPGYGCNCKGWTIKKKPLRDCKHIQALYNIMQKRQAA